MNKILELREKRAAAWDAAKKFLDAKRDNKGIVSAEDYEVMEDYTRKLFARGQEIAAKQGLILVDTKYEFGKRDGKVYLIDEIHRKIKRILKPQTQELPYYRLF